MALLSVGKTVGKTGLLTQWARLAGHAAGVGEHVSVVTGCDWEPMWFLLTVV